MSAYHIYAVLSVGLFTVGLYGFLFHVNLIRKVIALNVMGGSVFLLLIAVAYRDSSPNPDPVPHAMVLTGIVVAVSATALALAIIRRVYTETGSDSLEDRQENE